MKTELLKYIRDNVSIYYRAEPFIESEYDLDRQTFTFDCNYMIVYKDKKRYANSLKRCNEIILKKLKKKFPTLGTKRNNKLKNIR